jgi:hypothetical protein
MDGTSKPIVRYSWNRIGPRSERAEWPRDGRYGIIPAWSWSPAMKSQTEGSRGRDRLFARHQRELAAERRLIDALMSLELALGCISAEPMLASER